MSDIIKDLQQQSSGQGLVTLYELELPSGSTLYFHPGIKSNTAPIVFDGNTYESIPAEITGMEITSDGSASRPALTIANILAVFKNALGNNYTYEDLLNKKFTRRRTLESYLTSSPAVEYPKDVYFIDRIANKNIISITFELASPFDLEGVRLPNRIIIGGGCSWRYQGASPDLIASDKLGGCPWSRFSTVVVNGVSYTNYLNVNDEPVVSIFSTTPFPGSGILDEIYSISEANLIQINNDGTLSYGASSSSYWQATKNTSNTPSDSDVAWRRVRVYTQYSATATYKVFTDPSYNDYVVNIYDGGPRLFKKRYVTQTISLEGADPGYNEHWELADACGKRLSSCTQRFQYKPTAFNAPSTTYDQTVVLPFGGFPGSRTFQ